MKYKKMYFTIKQNYNDIRKGQRNHKGNKQNNKVQCSTNIYLWTKWFNIRNSFLIKSTGLAQCFGKGPGIEIKQFPSSICKHVLK